MPIKSVSKTFSSSLLDLDNSINMKSLGKTIPLFDCIIKGIHKNKRFNPDWCIAKEQANIKSLDINDFQEREKDSIESIPFGYGPSFVLNYIDKDEEKMLLGFQKNMYKIRNYYIFTVIFYNNMKVIPMNIPHVKPTFENPHSHVDSITNRGDIEKPEKIPDFLEIETSVMTIYLEFKDGKSL